jgi:threonine/homoserine/homoserine lactone efflux protein
MLRWGSHPLYALAVLSMLTYVLFGVSYGFAAAAQPGQLQAYLISRAVSHGWRRTLPAVFAPLLSDLPVIVLVLLVLTRVPPLMVRLLRLVGGVFLLYLAADAIRGWRANDAQQHLPEIPAHRTFIEAVFVNLLNPNPYLGWALVLGPWLLDAWGKSPSFGMALLAAFYSTLVVASGTMVVLFSLARALGPRVTRWLLGLSGIALGVFGVWQIWAGAATAW